MRITWYSNAPWCKSGYGGQTAQAVNRLIGAGHDVAVAANFGLQGVRIDWDGIPVFPSGRDKYSNDVAPGHHKLWAPDGWLITLYDVWGLDPQTWEGMRVASWTPIDHDPIPPAVEAWAKTHLTLAWSRFGVRACAERGIEALYIPLAIESAAFRPRSTLSRGQPTREAMGIPDDAFLAIINSANTGNHPPRKGWGEMFQAFAELTRRHSDAFLYVHADRYGYHGIDLPVLATAAGIPVDRLLWADQYALLNGLISDEDLAAMYTAADVLIQTSYGEGFGIPAIEAQACGTPVIVSDWTAQPELVGAGWTIPVQKLWDAPHSSWYGLPSVGHIVDALEAAYALKGDASVARVAIEKAAEYDADLVFDRWWKPALVEMERLL